MFDIKITGDRELSLRLDGIVRELPRVLRNIVNRGALEVKRRVIENLSGKVLNRRTGKLANSIQIAKGGPATNPWAIVGTNTIYAAIHELGGIIRAKNKPYLWFKIHSSTRTFTKSGERMKRSRAEYGWVRVKQVRIPARPFLAPALKDSISAIENIADQEIRRAIE
jgi:phage gpG-like protein